MNLLGKALFQGSEASDTDAAGDGSGAGTDATAARHPLPLFQASDTGALLAFLPTPRDTPPADTAQRLRCEWRVACGLAHAEPCSHLADAGMPL